MTLIDFFRRSILATVFVASTSATLLAESAANDRRAIQGVWTGGLPHEPEGSIELTITGDKISGRNARTGRSLGEGPYEMDPEHHVLDATKLALYGRGKLYRGLYSLSGNTLQWCATSRPARPADLQHKPGSEQYLMTFRRKK
jgi:hypothetical protein